MDEYLSSLENKPYYYQYFSLIFFYFIFICKRILSSYCMILAIEALGNDHDPMSVQSTPSKLISLVVVHFPSSWFPQIILSHPFKENWSSKLFRKDRRLLRSNSINLTPSRDSWSSNSPREKSWQSEQYCN